MQARALFEIRHYQQAVDLLLPKVSFQRLAREVTQDIIGPKAEPLRFQSYAILVMLGAPDMRI